MDWYSQRIYKVYEAKFLEKFFRKSPLKQWVGWYNRYNQSFNYEVYDPYTGLYIKRMVPRKFPYVTEFSFVACNDFFNRGLCIYRYQDTIYWFTIILGSNPDNRDDVIYTQPVAYPLPGCYYLYVHDVKHAWNDAKLAYLFIDDGNIRVFAIDTADPGTLHEADMSEVIDWCAELKPTPDVDLRLSKTAIETTGTHRAFYMVGSEDLPTYGVTRIFTMDTSYNEDQDSLVFKANIAGTLWWTNRPNPSTFPPFDSTDSEDHSFALMPHKYLGGWGSGVYYNAGELVYYGVYNYLCTSSHTSSYLNYPGSSPSAPWQTVYYPVPLGTVGYSYGLKLFPTDELDYEYVNWRTDADREWMLESQVVIVRTSGGFAYILIG